MLPVRKEMRNQLNNSSLELLRNSIALLINKIDLEDLESNSLGISQSKEVFDLQYFYKLLNIEKQFGF